MKNRITLYMDKKSCCGCAACMNECSQNAIEMVEDESGFLYPQINDEKCIGCGKCRKVCIYQTVDMKNQPRKVYAAARCDMEKILDSASGGIFAFFAEQVLKQQGVVFGAAMQKEGGELLIKHIAVDKIQDLSKLTGSKYAQSYTGMTYFETKKYLDQGKYVLFSGTPCQIAGLKTYLKRDYENLLTMDIICHGVPAGRFFSEYIRELEKKQGKPVIDFKFRDKKHGWGFNAYACVVFQKSDGSLEHTYFPCKESAYYSMFLSSDIHRENCYSCRYACKARVSDITVGDYWGIENEHPEYLEENGGTLQKKNGISVVLVNSAKGEVWYNKCEKFLRSYPSSFEKAAKRNTQLRQPSNCSKRRARILKLFREKGYTAVEQYYRPVFFRKKVTSYIREKLLK